MWRKSSDGKPSSEVPPSAPVSRPAVAQPPVRAVPAVAAAPEPVATRIPVPEPAPAPVVPAAPVASGTSRIGSGLKISGDISGSADLYIDGEVQGKVRLSSARASVGPNGKVQADIEANVISVDGTVQGNLKASESVHLGASSRVQGSVLTPRIGIDDGARLRGKVEMIRTAPPAPLAAAKAEIEPNSQALKPVGAVASDE